jgi:hypothetical protein
MGENSFKFKYGELEIEFSGEKTYVEEQIKTWKGFIDKNFPTFNQEQKQIFFKPNQENNVPEIKVKKNISIDDFIKLKAPENDADKTIVAAYYLERYEKYNSFNEEDIFKLAKIKDAEKFLAINLEKGFLSLFHKENSISDYTLTYSGEIYVREGLQEF